MKQSRKIERLLIIFVAGILSIFGSVYVIKSFAEWRLRESIVEGNLKDANWLLALMPSLSRSGQDGEPLTHSAIQMRNRDALNLLLRHGADMDIFCAAFLGDIDSIRSLTAENSAVLGDRFLGGQSALNAAVMGGNPAAVEVLIELGAKVEGSVVNSWTPLRRAVYEGKDDIARILLLNGAAADIFLHCGLGDIDRVSKHLDLNPTEMNAQDRTTRFTLLHWAAHRGRTEIVRLLLARGARADIWEPYEVGTALTVAQKAGYEKAGYEDVVEILREVTPPE